MRNKPVIGEEPTVRPPDGVAFEPVIAEVEPLAKRQRMARLPGSLCSSLPITPGPS